MFTACKRLMAVDYPGQAVPPVQSDSVPMPDLVFVYTTLLAPERLMSIAPNADFRFTAHFPSTRLKFVEGDGAPIPSLEASPDHIVWGAVFSVPFAEIVAITRAEKEEGRFAGWDMRATDRAGNKHECVTFVGPPDAEEVPPEQSYLDRVVSGARHWQLPAGWVVGLEDLIEDPLFS